MSTLNLSPARQKFWYISRLSEAELTTKHLVEGALAIAWEEYPRIDLAHYRAELDQMATEIQYRLRGISYPLKIIREINHYLFIEKQFRGNESNYYDPRNSFLNDVLERRLGIPITLSLVYLALGDRLNFPLEGVSFPGNFMIRPQDPEIEILIDPFAKGEILFKQDCAAKLKQLYGHAVPLHDEYLQPVGERKILERMLMNLKLIYLRQGQLHKALATIERILMLYPEAPIQLRDHGLLCYQLERYTEARADLEIYLDCMPYAEDAGLIAKLVEEIKFS